jgi:PA14 domain
MNSKFLSAALLGVIAFSLPAGQPPIALHPDNPHYFLWRGHPTILITSGEHYGAVLNLDFDYRKYLDTLARDRLNLTRTFTGGAYVEPAGSFNIAHNTLAPESGRFIAPWARSDQPGYAGGGNKFDLNRWNEDYFSRFRDFVAYASQRGVVVEVNLFCPMYGETQWRLSPFRAGNNVNGLGAIKRTDLYTLDRHGGLLAVQDRMVRKFVAELKDFDNVYYEICNEPYFGGVTLEWQHHIADVIVDAQKGQAHPKLISRNVANNSAKVEHPSPAVSIFNFHYATPPDTVALNYSLNKVIGDNETGFRGTNNAPYRTEAWDFILAGGGLFNHLDYSFVAGQEDGTFVYPASQPGGGNPDLRRQFRILRDFIYGLDFIHMKPVNTVLADGGPSGGTARALVQPGWAYAVYLRQESSTGLYSVRWTGSLVPQYSEEYTFHTVSNDGVRLWVGDKQLVDNWTDHGQTEDTGKIHLAAGRSYPLKLEYFYNGGQGVMKLMWSSRSQKKRPIPASQLRLPAGRGTGHGLHGDYFHGNNFQKAWAGRDDANVNFAWGTKSPLAVERGAGETVLKLDLPKGRYRVEWVDTKSGAVARQDKLDHAGGVCSLAAPAFRTDIALRVLRQ